MIDEFIYLTPNNQWTKHNLQTIKKVVSNHDNISSTCRPSFIGTNSLDTWISCKEKH